MSETWPYSFGYKTEAFFLPKHLKNLDPSYFLPKHSTNLDPSYKTDLDCWDCFGRENPIKKPNQNRQDYIPDVLLERERPVL